MSKNSYNYSGVDSNAVKKIIMSLRGDKYKYAWNNYRYISC